MGGESQGNINELRNWKASLSLVVTANQRNSRESEGSARATQLRNRTGRVKRRV